MKDNKIITLRQVNYCHFLISLQFNKDANFGNPKLYTFADYKT